MLSFLGGLLWAMAGGLNPFLPLFVAAAMARFTNRFQPLPRYAFLGETWFVVTAGILLLAELFLDKMYLPGVSLAVPAGERDRKKWLGAMHDLSQMLLGPLAGALVLAASDRVFPASWFLVAPMVGALVAGAVYAARRSLRQRLVLRWATPVQPLGNLFLSTMGDLIAVLISVAGLVVGMAGP
ncbi:MAG: DUF4126 domain-containing protein [Chloroflexia bacterium]